MVQYVVILLTFTLPITLGAAIEFMLRPRPYRHWIDEAIEANGLLPCVVTEPEPERPSEEQDEPKAENRQRCPNCGGYHDDDDDSEPDGSNVPLVPVTIVQGRYTIIVDDFMESVYQSCERDKDKLRSMNANLLSKAPGVFGRLLTERLNVDHTIECRHIGMQTRKPHHIYPNGLN